MAIQNTLGEALKVAPLAGLQQASAKLNARLAAGFVTWLGVRGLSASTQEHYGRTARDFARFLRGASILAATHAETLGYLTALYERGLSKQSVFAYVEALHALQKYINLVELPSTGALGRISVPKVPHRIGDFHTYEEVEQLIAAARAPRERAVIELAFATACRISELARIRVEQIDWRDRKIVVFGKGSKERVVFFGGPAEEALREYLQGRTEGFLFCAERRQENPLLCRHRTPRAAAMALLEIYERERGTHIEIPRVDRALSIRQLHRIIVAVGRRAGLKTHPHALRHAAATAMLNHGAGLREIQTLLGHSALSQTARYLHSTTADITETHQRYHPRG